MFLRQRILKRVTEFARRYLILAEAVGRTKTCAVLVTKQGTIRYFGKNKRKSHPLQAQFGRNSFSIFLHAEVSCLIHTGFRNSVLTREPLMMIVVRVLKDGTLGMCKPCIGCQKALAQYNITTVYYTNESGEFEKL